MQTDIQKRNCDLTHAQRRLRFAFTQAGNHVQRIIVRLPDINRPRGGEDKRCHLQVVLSGLPDVIVEDTEADLYFAIDRAADRAGRSVMHRINLWVANTWLSPENHQSDSLVRERNLPNKRKYVIRCS